jgi:hypothetical protein
MTPMPRTDPHVPRARGRAPSLAASVLALSSLFFSACDSHTGNTRAFPDAGDAGGGPGTPDGGVGDCPDPRDVHVHYQAKDLANCPPLDAFNCAADQNGFYDSCGCGCIDKGTSMCTVDPDPRVHFVSQDPAECQTKTIPCTVLQQAFNDACGCGCIDP